MVLTLVVTIFTDTASIVDHDFPDGFTICLRDSPSFSFPLLWPCNFQSSSPRPHRDSFSLLTTFWTSLYESVAFFLRCFHRPFGFCSILFFVSTFETFVTLDVNCQRPHIFHSLLNAGLTVSSCCHPRLHENIARSTDVSPYQTICL